MQPPEGSDIIDLPPHSRKDGIGPDNIRKLAEKGYKDTNNEEVKERGSYPIAFSNADNWHWYAIVRIPCSGATISHAKSSLVGEVYQEQMH